MVKVSWILLLAFGVYACRATYDPNSYMDRQCGSDITNLWLETVAVVDNSKGMRDDGLLAIASTISSIYAAGTRIGSNYTDPRSTRLGLVTYNQVATENADLNKFQNLDDIFNNVYPALSSVSHTDTSLLAEGLSMAEKVLNEGKGSGRVHFHKAIIVFASAYEGKGVEDPKSVADRLKTSGIRIITVAYNQLHDQALLDDLKMIASPRMAFSNSDSNLLDLIRGALMEVNCYCPDNWVQYRTSFSDISSPPFGLCLQGVGIQAVWRAAQGNCRNRKLGNAYLAMEFNQAKHDYVLAVAKNTTGIMMPYSYHIGLTMVAGQWVWDQPVGWPQIPLQTGNWTGWGNGMPVASSSMSGVMNLQSGNDAFWNNISLFNKGAGYVCEVYSCDTDRYCVPEDD